MGKGQSGNNVSRRNKMGGSNSLMAQMAKYQQNAKQTQNPPTKVKVPRPWESGKAKKSVSAETLKPSIAASMSTHERHRRSKSKIDFSNSKSKVATKKPNARATSLMAQRRCQKCKSAIFGKNGVEGPDGSVYHPNCFRCADCDKE